jgi:hypothetical protein
MKTSLRQLTPVALLAVISIASCGTASADTLMVTSAADDGGGDTLRDAIAAAQPGDSIVFDPSLNGQTIVLTNGALHIDQSLDIEGPGADLLAISGNRTSNVIAVSGTGPVTIAGLTIRDGEGGWGGGIFNAGVLTLRDCTISNNYAEYGGGIFNNGTLTLSHCELSWNVVYLNGTTAPLEGSYIAGGGGLYNSGEGSVTIADGSTISRNVAATDRLGGGGIYNAGLLELSDSTVSNNDASVDSAAEDGATGNGGGIYNGFDATGVYNSSVVVLKLTNCTVSGNTAYDGSGGGIYNSGYCDVELHGTLVTKNTAGGYYGWPTGDGVWNDGQISILDSSILSGNALSDVEEGPYGSYTIDASSSVGVLWDPYAPQPQQKGHNGKGGGKGNNK